MLLFLQQTGCWNVASPDILIFLLLSAVSNSMRQLCTTTSILTDPSRVPEQAVQAALQLGKNGGGGA